MVGISALLQQIPPIPRTAPSLLRTSQFTPPWLPKTLIKSPKNESRLVAFAAERGPNKGQNGSGNGRDDMKRNGRPIFSLKWQDLLDPDPENILAVGLTGLLTWASVQMGEKNITSYSLVDDWAYTFLGMRCVWKLKAIVAVDIEPSKTG
ncbi:uncharacterized protein LOC131235390 isoform X4 [Magnolia sinica]|uniref:uncharacterized protein LOC131235390 isoform X4 n=1 Tax=Magnolia sinica TaxID=86752 RepID=UPI00265B4E23|nr:uncharacterized protein LOC131235390 isoform X4 [Magnolia sinica]